MAPTSTKNSIKHFDYLVIGGGSGGVASARRAAKYGAKVLLIESNFKKFGGTCVNVGCVPKKVMWYTADLAHKKHDLYAYGLDKEPESIKYGDFDWAKLKHKRDAYVTRLNGIYENNLKREKVDYAYGFAKFINSEGEVEVTLSGDQELPFLDEGKTYKKGEKLVFSADMTLIATGGTAIVPPSVPGAELGTTSDGFFALEKQPKKVAIVGAGYIGVELSGVFSSLGSETHFFIRGDTVLRSFDEVIQNTVTDYYIDNLGINIHKQSTITKIEGSKDGKKVVHLKDGTSVEVDELIWTVGRKSLIDIGLDKVGVKINDKQQIVADEYQVTNNPKIFSLGDVVGKVELTPVAIAAVSSIDIVSDCKIMDIHIHQCILTSRAGLWFITREPLKIRGGNLKYIILNLSPMYYAMMMIKKINHLSSTRSFVSDPEEKVIKMGATKKDFDNCVAIHPTSAEELVTMT
uniref:Glutathione reductase n=1 Tax=Candida albicans TaxID=5476 RepID=Q9UV69_CANAX|nr:glutathione reductase [Candida albicans]